MDESCSLICVGRLSIEKYGIPVLGGIFNKLRVDGGFYSLENCKAQISLYFGQNEQQQALGRQPFGFVPLVPGIAGKSGMDHVEEFVDDINVEEFGPKTFVSFSLIL